jgi:nitric oxide reductase NorD protein
VTAEGAWQRVVGGGSSWPHHPAAAVRLDRMHARLGVIFRALGGAGTVQLMAGKETPSRHRMSLRTRLEVAVRALSSDDIEPPPGVPPRAFNLPPELPLRYRLEYAAAERLDIARFDGVVLHLPQVLDLLPDRAGNVALYEWLAAWFALTPPPGPAPRDPLRRDIARLRAARAQTERLLAVLPGLRPLHDRLATTLRKARPRRLLRGEEAAVEAAVRAALGDPAPLRPRAAALLDPATPLETWRARSSYRPFLPVPLWGEVEGEELPEEQEARHGRQGTSGNGGARQSKGTRQQSRGSESDEPEQRPDPSQADDAEGARGPTEATDQPRRAEDGGGQGERETSAREEAGTPDPAPQRADSANELDMHAEVPGAGGEGVPLAAAAPETFTYPEWDHARARWRPAHCRVIAEPVRDDAPEGEDWQPDEATHRRIRRVRRQFESLRPRRQVLPAQPDGDDLDLSAVVQSLADRRAGMQGSERVYHAGRTVQRDLSVLVLVDVSSSTDDRVADRRILDVQKEALIALSGGLDACGDEHAIFTFTSRRRDAVWLRTVKEFEERAGAPVVRRIHALRPGHFTRMGAAVRHATRRLSERPREHRLLLLLTDGKPNDDDHYEGRYAVEDTRMAVQEARGAGCKVFGITVDREAREYVPHIFGAGAYAIFPDISRLPAALPAIYRQVTR